MKIRVSREPDYKKSENPTWDSHQRDAGILTLLQNPYALWKKLVLLKVSDFYKETRRKTDKTNHEVVRASWAGRELAGTAFLASSMLVSGNPPVLAQVPCGGPCTKDAAEPPVKAGVPGGTKKA